MGSNLDGIYLLDGHFFTLISCKKLLVCLKRPKINEKEAGVGPFLKKVHLLHFGHDLFTMIKVMLQRALIDYI